jgi:hypothetical protein
MISMPAIMNRGIYVRHSCDVWRSSDPIFLQKFRVLIDSRLQSSIDLSARICVSGMFFAREHYNAYPFLSDYGRQGQKGALWCSERWTESLGLSRSKTFMLPLGPPRIFQWKYRLLMLTKSSFHSFTSFSSSWLCDQIQCSDWCLIWPTLLRRKASKNHQSK